MPHEDDSGQLREGLYDVEVAQGTDLKKRHAVLLRISPGLFRWHLPLEGEVEPVSHQDPRDTWGMLIYFLYPSVYAIEGPAISDVVHQENSLGSSRVGSENGAKSSLP